eukprot:COSAG02_NODE_1375_length_13001_cov_3.495272_3_plen_158_part_00
MQEACSHCTSIATCSNITECVETPGSATPTSPDVGPQYTTDDGAAEEMLHAIKVAMLYQNIWLWLAPIATCLKFEEWSGLCQACTLAVCLIGLHYTWFEMFSVVFGDAGDQCGAASGPDAGDIAGLTSLAKVSIWIQCVLLLVVMLCAVGCVAACAM